MALLQSIIDGLLLGGVYGVVATGLSLVFGVLGIVNFAQAQFLMLGMYAAWFTWSIFGIDPILGAPLAFLVTFAIGYLTQNFLIRHIMKAPAAAQIFLTVGLMVVLENLALIIFGSDFRSVTVTYQTQSLRLGEIFT